MIARSSKTSPTRHIGMMLRVSAEEHKLFIRCARNDNRSLSGWARVRLLEAVEREQKEAEEESRRSY
jgi:hypothetical protein